MSARKIGRICTLPLLLALACAPRSAVQSRPSPPSSPSPAPKKRTPGNDRAFFVVVPQIEDLNGEAVDQPALVPLACLHEGELRGGRACLGLVPRGQQVGLEGGQRVAVAGRVRPHCEGEVSKAIGLALWSDPKEEVTYALWPPSDAKATFKPIRRGTPYDPSNCRGWCSFERTGHPRVRISTEQRRWLADRVARTAPELGAGQARALSVAQEVSLDLDGDGKKDQIYAVTVVDRDADRYAFLFSALYFASGRSPDRLTLLRRQDSDAIVLRGTLDLDRDGQRELWLIFIPTSGQGHGNAVLSLGREGPEVIGSYICRPQSDNDGE